LFALGALAYALLTGREAYPAPDLDALRDVWRSALHAPSRLNRELPRALDDLVLSMLSLDRERRPSSAAEVALHASELSQLAPGRPVAPRMLGSATVPRLVGRDLELLELRRCVLSLLGGTGGALMIEGPQGSGRSRMLDACVLEGKLLGATVVRVDAAGSTADWSSARRMCLQLLPELATAFKGLPRHVLGRVIASVQGGESGPGALAALERDLVLRELRDFMLALTRGQRLVLAVDDVDRIDEPSAALIALLAQRADDHGLLVAATASPAAGMTAQAGAALRLLRSVSMSLSLGPLAQADGERLMRGVLGEASGAVQAGRRLHRIAKGNPGAMHDWIQHWTERGQIQREGGGWTLQRDAGKSADQVASLLAGRIGQLSADALELARALGAADGESLGLAQYARLTTHRDFARVSRALVELVERQILVMEPTGYRFAQSGYVALLREGLPPEIKRAVHRVLADQLAHGGHDAWRRARHLFEAGRDEEAVALLLRVGVPAEPQSVAFLRRVLAARGQHPMPARFVHGISRALLSASIAELEPDVIRDVLPALLADAERASGAERFAERPERPLEERRREALEHAERAYQSAHETERILMPWEARNVLVTTCVEVSDLALKLYDPTWLDLLPDFALLAGFSEEFDAVAELLAGSRDTLHGRVVQALAAYERAQGLLAERSPHAPVEELRSALRFSVRKQLGSLHAGIGSREAEPHAQILEAQRESRVAAYRVRARMYASRGNVAEARKWQQRYELLQLQHGSRSPDPAGDAGFELLIQAFSGDLAGIERSLVGVGEFADRFAGWRGAFCLGDCHRRWLQGDLEGAVAALGPALDSGLAGRHPHWGHAIAVHVVLLCEQGQPQEAVTRGRAYERMCHRLQVGLADRWLRQGLGYALGRNGKYNAASALLDQLIEQLEGLGIGGLPLGSAYEIRAKVALYASDRPAFEQAAQRCADAYLETNNPAMTSKVAQLAEEAAELERPALA
jgi:hypothetical protein